MDSKFELTDALEWFQFDAKHLEMDIMDGIDVGDRLEQYKWVCEKIAEIVNEFVFPDRPEAAHGCCEECDGCITDASDKVNPEDDGENGYNA